MELHEENDFKVKSYQNAVFGLEKASKPLESMPLSELAALKGVGKAIAANINELNETGKLQVLEDLLEKTPKGLLELLKIKGLGAKKIRILWKELNIENKEQLMEAIEKDALVKVKGFGKKTQENIRSAISFEEANLGKLLYSQAEAFTLELQELVKKYYPGIELQITGEVRRKCEIIEEIKFLAEEKHKNTLINFFLDTGLFVEQTTSSPINWRAKTKEHEVCVTVRFYTGNITPILFLTTGTGNHLGHETENISLRKLATRNNIANEKEIYIKAKLPFIIPELREGCHEFEMKEEEFQKLITTKDLKGILHNHTTYSDGKNTILEMAEYCRNLGYEYIGINDHSKSAYFYANGMFEEQVEQQQIEIDKVNKEVAPFKIFKGIEVDILQDGSLDYNNETLETFDFVVASIHSALTMDKLKATERVIRAVSHPLTTMLGHMTGRLLLRRDGYLIDHKAVIDVCAENNVIIELNANPRRLDINWRWIRYAMEKNVMISINPDAHVKEGLMDIYYGVCSARKGGLTKEMTFNTKSAKEADEFFKARKEKALKKLYDQKS